jgi:hypothetical protein
MLKLKGVAFAAVFLITGLVLWWVVEISLPIVIVIELILAVVIGLSWFLWRWSSDDESARFVGSSGHGSPRFEQPVRSVQSNRPTRETLVRPNDQQFEAMVAWRASVDERLERIEARLRRLNDGPRLGTNALPEQPAQRTSYRSEEAASHWVGSSNTGSEFVQIACQAYRKLAREGLRDLPLEPIFVVLDIDSSAQTSAIEEVRRNFRQATTKQSEFIIFRNSSTEAWLFPNPRISFTEAMKYVFPYLTYENFEGVTDSIAPERVRQTSPETWEMVTDGRE